MKPNRWKPTALWIIFVLSLLVLGIGCASKEERKAKHWKRAGEYIEKSEFKKAVIELRNVIQLDPRDAGALYELGETYLKLKKGKKAFRFFTRTVSMNPDNLKAQFKVGQILLLRKKTEEAREKAELILEKSPNSIEGLLLLSGVQIQEKEMYSAKTTLERAAALDPNHFQTRLSLARLLHLTGDFKRSEQSYLKAMSLDSSSSVPYIELSRIYVTRGQWDKAESELKKMTRASNSGYQNLHVLARFYESAEKWDQAEKTYLEAADSKAKEDFEPSMTLGEYYARRKSYDKALEAMQKALAIKKDDLDILASIAQLHLNFRQIEDAEATVDKVLAKDKGHVRANFLKGRLYLLEEDFNNALERFDSVLRESPVSDVAHYFKALSLRGKGNIRLAQKDLLKAVGLNPRLLDARLILAEDYIRERKQDLARQQIERMLQQAPSHVGVLMLQGNLKIIERDAKGAETAYKKVVKLDPDYAPVYVRLGLLYNLTRRQADALKSFKKALELNPRQNYAFASIVGIYIREKKYDEAFQFCEKQKQKTGEDPTLLAQIEYLKGAISLAEKDSRKAEQHLDKAIEIDPNMLAPYVVLARLFLWEKRLDEAVSKYTTILGKNPGYLAGYMIMGTLYDLQGDVAEAETYYRKALEIKNDFAPAANNLAWNLAETGGNIDEALGFARVAKEQMPRNGAVMDTLGWIYYLKGSYLNAIAELNESVERVPQDPLVNYHLGLAYYKNNRPDAAKEFLGKALRIDRDFKGAEEARSILKDIEASATSE